MSKLRCLLAALGWAIAGAVSAQSAMPGAAAAPMSGTDSAGLERAQRLAANPLKMILEAGRSSSRPAGEGTAPGATAPATRQTAARAALSGASGAETGPAITVILQLPADLPHAEPLGPGLTVLPPAPAPLAPVTLEALRSLPWPSEVAPRGTEPPSPRRLAGPAADGAPLPASRLAQAEQP